MEIEYSKAAAKYLNSQDRPTKQRIRAGILGLTETPPRGDIKQMKGYPGGEMRLRVGGYRVIYRYSAQGNLEVLEIGSRGDIYK